MHAYTISLRITKRYVYKQDKYSITTAYKFFVKPDANQLKAGTWLNLKLLLCKKSACAVIAPIIPQL